MGLFSILIYVLEKKWLDNCIHRLQFSSHYFSKTCYLKTVIEGTCSSHDQRWKPVKRLRWNLSAKKNNSILDPWHGPGPSSDDNYPCKDHWSKMSFTLE